jgi:hypothetical protein
MDLCRKLPSLTHLKSLEGLGNAFQTYSEILPTLFPQRKKLGEKNLEAKPSKPKNFNLLLNIQYYKIFKLEGLLMI